MQPGGLGAGQLGARSLVAAELEETPKMGIRAQVKLGGRGSSSPYPALRAPSALELLKGQRRGTQEGGDEVPGTGLIAAEV